MKTYIIVDEGNKYKLENLIKNVEKNHTERRSIVWDLYSLVDAVEIRLKCLHIPKTKWGGLIFLLCNSTEHDIPFHIKRYAPMPLSTIFEIKRIGGFWVLTRAERMRTPYKKIRCINETEYQKFFRF